MLCTSGNEAPQCMVHSGGPCNVTVRVLDALTGSPVDGASTVFSNDEGCVLIRDSTDDQGYVRLSGIAFNEIVTIKVEKEPYYDGSRRRVVVTKNYCK